MTQEDKQLLIKDLCARLPYGVKVKSKNGEVAILVNPPTAIQDDCWNFKPYLRPMSSMTEEEKKEFKDIFNGFFQYFNHGIISDSRLWDKNEAVFVGELSCSKLIDWLNAHHFDYRKLIPMGLALEAPEDMYKND